jgi:hypothetical protein
MNVLCIVEEEALQREKKDSDIGLRKNFEICRIKNKSKEHLIRACHFTLARWENWGSTYKQHSSEVL